VNSYRFWTFILIFLMLVSITPIECRSSETVGSLYVVASEAALLRDNPSPDSGIITRLQNLDKVEYLDSNASGWWKVRSQRTGTVGWMTADLLSPASSASPPAAPAKPVYSYANTPFDLRSIPLYAAAASGSVQLNDPVEKLGFSPEGWTKVRNPRNGSRGWLPTHYLSSDIVCTPPRAYTPKKRFKQRALPSKKKQIEETPAPEKAKPM
jgi:hypothetical protein